ncbi:MmcQ/YjbR family DNA-binding protein [Pseudaestuariivita atlantica]|uniref:MmcQ/YjbR family DNA-binding protein n=1 Tax=Pseudaestuariivita atlantica TaxID=1317121 RepID=A0A0L1JME9_9RHOB|nr:MmcQ/YjbR family DNA-binding protein [Pseudaestuariivita atlantica]KNG92907.1 hypothetical protein ATO11_15750 [Pseudaestuariivita atlantica]
MSRDTVNQICSSFPGAEWSDPWGGGHDAWKVGTKMFACMGIANDGVSVKTSSIEIAELMIDTGDAERAPYFHKSWVRLPFNADPDFLRKTLETSYDLVRASLTKRVQASIPPRT